MNHTPSALRPAWLALALAAAIPTAALAKPPRLTLVVTIDSLGTDQLLRMRPRFKGPGLGTLMAQGAFFPNTRVEYADAHTGPGHATLVTGANPWRHGVIGNDLLNRATLKLEPVFADADHPILEAPPGVQDVSPANLLAESLADRVRLFTQERGKAISVAPKPRAAIAMGGRLGQAWWFSEAVGKWVTGTWYTKEFPGWVKAFNDKALPDGYFGKEWTLLEKKDAYQGEDDRPFEGGLYALGRTFPHPLSGGLPRPGKEFYTALNWSPLMAEVLVQFVKAAIEGEQLGKDDVPDILFVSFSQNDYVNHLYGPFSWEAQDALLRIDKALGEVVALAERAAGGRANLLVVVTADHGMAAVPEEWAARGVPAMRVAPAPVQQALTKELSARFGGDVVATIETLNVYLTGKGYGAAKDGAAVRRAAAAWLAKQPGVAIAVARDDLESAGDLRGYGRALRLTYHPDRSGDVLFVPRAFAVWDTESFGTDHGSPYAYDCQIPLVVAGHGVKSGHYAQDISLADVAPTVATLMEMGVPAQAEGKVRAEIVANSSGAKPAAAPAQ
ncbi:MAG TPA: alkaline phosphatase family protein [Myxococcales bacterium]|nr:alkaline phosphatase family protein [Myxococcales bacterium]